MTRFPFAVILAAAAAVCALAQPPGQKMGASSTLVFGAVPDGKQGFNFISRGGGFFIDSRHVVANVTDCCGKSDKGEQATPVVVWGKDDVGAAKVIWSNEDSEIAILELEKPLNHPGVAIAPSKLVQEGQPVYSVQYPKPGENGAAQIVEGKLIGGGTYGDKKIPLYKSSVQMNANNAGGALFDACGNAIGINLLMKEGQQYAFVIDPLIGALQAAGVQATVADQPCSASGGGGAASAQGGGGSQGGGDGGKQTKGKTKGGESEPRSQWRWPNGAEWIPVVIVVGLLVLAFRPARRQMVQAVTGRHRIPEPAPYPYPGAPPAPYAPAPTPYGGFPGMGAGMQAPPVPVVVGTKPVLKGITGEYAGSGFSLEGGSSTLGRDPSAANLVFTGEASSVSKRHCSVRWDAGRGLFLLEDYGSTNGTFLASGERLTPHQPRELRPGERFYIGDLRNQFEVTLEL